VRIRYSQGENGKLIKKAAVYTGKEHGILRENVDPEAVYIIERLKAAGYDAYIVGGAVRDLILGKKPKDFDIVTEASPSRIKKIFRNARIIGHRFRLVHVYFGPKIFEVCTFRSMKDGPTSNTFGTIEEDVLRRDFTLNALFYDPQEELVVDYVGGMRDIHRRRIEPIIPLSRIFIDDPVRMIRAVKYGAAAGFKLPLPLIWRIRKDADLLKGISPSRLTEEIFKIIHSPCAARIVEALDEHNLYVYLQPEAVKLFRKSPDFRDRYLRSLAAINGTGFQDRPGEAFSALVRDYVDDYTSWEGDSPEHQAQSGLERYREACMGARKFVLPINPPRVELEQGIRLIFADHGITVKKSRVGERVRPAPGAPAGEALPLPPEEASISRHRRRRRRPRKAPPEE